MENTNWVMFGTQLSPFALKIAAAMEAKKVPFQWNWQLGVMSQAIVEAKVRLLKQGWLTVHIPEKVSELDEFPLVPFLFGDDGTNAYDSTSILNALHIDDALDPATKFLSHFLEEFFDEWGLYVVHHMRWTDPKNVKIWKDAPEKGPGEYLFNQEMYGSSLLPGFIGKQYSNWFSKRQQNRLPYFLSVRPVDAVQTGWDETDQFMTDSFFHILASCEKILSHQNSLLFPWRGPSDLLCCADFSCFGQLNMLGHMDRGTRDSMTKVAPNVVSWLDTIQLRIQAHTGQAVFPLAATPLNNAGDDESNIATKGGTPEEGFLGLQQLLQHACDVFIPLMKANELAYESYKGRGERLFNEEAFRKRKTLFQVTLRALGKSQSFTICTKTFQVKAWRQVRSHWQHLPSSVKDELCHRTGIDLKEAMNRPPPAVKLVSGPEASKL